MSSLANKSTYNAVVVDSGFIIKKTGLSHLFPVSTSFYTPPEVISEIRDPAARAHLESLPFTLEPRIPTKDAMLKVAQFARLTGDYRSLSVVDLKVLALAYDLELEGCGSVSHLRSEPRKGNGKKKRRQRNRKKKKKKNKGQQKEGGEEVVGIKQKEEEEVGSDDDGSDSSSPPSSPQPTTKSWAMLVNPTAKPIPPTTSSNNTISIPTSDDANAEGGQFDNASESSSSEASEEEEEAVDYSDDDTYAGSDCDISDEECDIYVLDEEEVEERKRMGGKLNVVGGGEDGAGAAEEEGGILDEELMPDFPSLSAAATVPYEGSDDEGDTGVTKPAVVNDDDEIDDEEKAKKEALEPLTKTKDGRLYNSFKSYKDLVTPTGVTIQENRKTPLPKPNVATPEKQSSGIEGSRIIGGATAHTSQSSQVEDDGEGWVGSENLDSSSMAFDATALPPPPPTSATSGPSTTSRCACATTDFAMQNVLLQMGMCLLSIDGVAITNTKNWVTRCGACFAVYGGETAGSRLFCARCGSDALQRVAASTDSATGKLKLHLSSKRRNDTRGTKFSLPKPGKQNRFAGDLLLREDQMLMGAWNMKVKKGAKKVESMFGDDIVDNVGLGDLSKRNDIKVGMGRQNPNQAKAGRERRGKAKKSKENKACGMRRHWS